MFKLWHVAKTIDDITQPDIRQPEIVSATIIITDSTGKKDTMKLEDYLKQNKIGDTTGK